MEWSKALSPDNDQDGLLFNLSGNMDVLRSLNEHLEKLNHASRDGKEQPLVIVAQNPLDMVSYPMNQQVGADMRRLNELMLDSCNMVGHMVVPQNRVEVTHGFAGCKGNCMWFNTGGSVLLLTVQSADNARSILLNPGFGFCFGKQEKYSRVFLSSFDGAEELFNDPESAPQRPHAMFFGCDKGDLESWRGALNAEAPAQEYKELNLQNRFGRPEVRTEERARRLGVEPVNNRRAHIRIAPMKGCDMRKDFLSQKIDAVSKWIKNTITHAKLNPIPVNFSVVKGMENPKVGDPFEVLWVKFDFDDCLWNDEVMWDIRYLLMGSKMDRLPGFPPELSGARETIYISRDGDSERRRRMGGL